MLLALRRIAALASVIAAALAIPALASAAEFKVTGTGDSGEAAAKAACETGVGECTLRAAIADANLAPDLDEITFGPTFDGGSGSKISLGSTLYISQPVKIIGTVTEVFGKPIPDAEVHVGSTAFSISASETVIEGIGIEASSIGVQILGGRGAVVRDNFISGVTGTLPQAGVEINPGNGNTGNLVEGNRIQVPGYYSWGIAIQYGANKIFGNEIEGGREGIENDGCCYQGIYVESNGAGNQIGGDTPQSENVITNFWYGAIRITTSNPNEIGRNRGLSTSSGFISVGGSTPAPTIATAQQPKVTGTAEPGATVRVFKTQSEFLNEIEGFVGKATAGLDGKWEASLTGVPSGTLVTATATLNGETSGLSATSAVTPEPEKEKEEEKGGGGSGGGEAGGGGSTPGGGTTTPSTSTSTPTPITTIAPPPLTAPTVKITRGPKKSSTVTTAKFTFKAERTAGAKFECKLDKAKKWASCRSPRTYRGLKPGKHRFRVRATASGLTGAVTKFQFTTRP